MRSIKFRFTVKFAQSDESSKKSFLIQKNREKNKVGQWGTLNAKLPTIRPRLVIRSLELLIIMILTESLTTPNPRLGLFVC